MTRWDRIAFLILAVLSAFPALGQAAGASAAAHRNQVVSSAPKGAPFLSGARQSFRVVVGLRAVGRGGATPEARLEALGLPSSDLVDVVGPFVVFQRAATGATSAARVAESSAVARMDRTPVYPVVVNGRTGQLGILPGVLIAKLRKTADAAAIAEAHGLSIDYVAEMIEYGFFRVPDGKDIVSAAAALAKDPRVESAYPEIRDHFATPN